MWMTRSIMGGWGLVRENMSGVRVREIPAKAVGESAGGSPWTEEDPIGAGVGWSSSFIETKYSSTHSTRQPSISAVSRIEISPCSPKLRGGELGTLLSCIMLPSPTSTSLLSILSRVLPPLFDHPLYLMRSIPPKRNPIALLGTPGDLPISNHQAQVERVVNENQTRMKASPNVENVRPINQSHWYWVNVVVIAIRIEWMPTSFDVPAPICLWCLPRPWRPGWLICQLLTWLWTSLPFPRGVPHPQVAEQRFAIRMYI